MTQRILIFSGIMVLLSCKKQEFKTNPPDERLAGKYVYVFTREPYDSTLVQVPTTEQEVYLQISKFNNKTAAFTADLYVNDALVRHYVLVEHDYQSFPGEETSCDIYKPEHGEALRMWHDAYDHYNFNGDNSFYFYNYDFPSTGSGYRNYFVKE